MKEEKFPPTLPGGFNEITPLLKERLNQFGQQKDEMLETNGK